jgi:ATP-dependent Clp protease ATP-binding subunit ClpB
MATTNPQERWTRKAQEILSSAAVAAAQARNPQLTTTHLLRALISETGAIQSVIAATSLDLDALRSGLDAQLAKLPVASQDAEPRPDATFMRLMGDVDKLATEMGDGYVTAEHLLLSMLSLEPTRKALQDAGLTRQDLQDAISKVRGGQKVESQQAEESYQALEKYGQDLTQLAREGKLDPVIGRDNEIRRVMQILTRRTKNNPVLIGEPGVGKTAVVEGLAQRIATGDAPVTLADKRVWSLDMSSLVAGAKYRGEFEERLKSVLKEIKASQGEIIVFIDELHTMVKAGGGEGAMDAGNMMKPMLARGELHVVGATTLDEYRLHVEKDAALERRFAPVLLDEPSVVDTIAILRGLKERYEVHHKIRITDSALVAAATLSDRYISDRFLPDKAIDLVDEAASRLRMEIDSRPQELDQLERKVSQQMIEAQMLRKETDERSKKRLTQLEEEIAETEEAAADLRGRWQREQEILTRAADAQKRLDELNFEYEAAQRDSNYERASTIQYGEIPKAQQERETAEAELAELRAQGGSLLRENVDEEDISRVVSEWTGIPVSQLMEAEMDKLMHMEQSIHERLIGQDQAVEAVADAIRRSRAGMSDPNRPIGSFMFLGPTGVGKTELARSLAAFLFDDERAMIRIDMSEYMEKHSVSRLVGAPPGYVGYDEGGQLTEAIRRRPYSVILLDEIEKAHVDVFNILLQVLDDGRLTDSQGRTVDFRNTVLIMTSNLGSRHMGLGFADDDSHEAVLADMREHFRPEFLNRIDEIVVFEPLDPDQIRQIVDVQIRRIEERMYERDLTLVVDQSAREHLAHTGYDIAYGARPLKRALQKQVENPISKLVLSGKAGPGDTVTATLAEGDKTLSFTVDSPDQ